MKIGWLTFFYGMAFGMHVAFVLVSCMLLGHPGFFTTITASIAMPLMFLFARQQIRLLDDRTDDTKQKVSA